jgi:PAS domain S-box-containing protein
LVESAPKSILQQIVSGLSEGVILVAPDGRITWANDAALAMHGATTLRDLGADAAGYRKRFRLKNRRNQALRRESYPIERVLAGEELRDVILQVFRPGEEDPAWVHRIRTLVARDETGRSDCCVLIINDATERFEAEERFEATFAANPAPAIICRVADKRFVKVNQGFVDMTGVARETLLSQSVHDFDVLAGAERRSVAADRLEAGETIPQMEALLRLPEGRTKAVIVAGQPIEVGGEACMLFTFADLEPRSKVEAALRQSEARFQSAFRLSPVPIVLLAGDGLSIEAANDAFASTLGWSEADAVGKTFAELGLWAREEHGAAFVAAVEADAVRGFECCIQPRGQVGPLDCLISAEAAVVNDRRSLFCVVQDITDRKRSERDLKAAIDAAMTDTSWLTRSILDKLAAIKAPAAEDGSGVRLDDLSGRERQVLVLVCKGASDAEIGQHLSLSRNTVRNHVAALYRRLGVHSRSEAIIWARDRGITDGSAPKN